MAVCLTADCLMQRCLLRTCCMLCVGWSLRVPCCARRAGPMRRRRAHSCSCGAGCTVYLYVACRRHGGAAAVVCRAFVVPSASCCEHSVQHGGVPAAPRAASGCSLISTRPSVACAARVLPIPIASPSPGNVSIAARRRRLSSADRDGATRSKAEAKKGAADAEHLGQTLCDARYTSLRARSAKRPGAGAGLARAGLGLGWAALQCWAAGGFVLRVRACATCGWRRCGVCTERVTAALR